jgi:hypothetical protein
VQGTSVPVECQWFDVRVSGLEPGAQVTVELELAIDGAYAPGAAREGTRADAQGVVYLGQHEASSDYDGLCPTGTCAGGFPVADQATGARVTVLDADEQRLARVKYALAELRSS